MDLGKRGIQVSAYLTKILPKEELERKLHDAIRLARERLARELQDQAKPPALLAGKVRGSQATTEAKNDDQLTTDTYHEIGRSSPTACLDLIGPDAIEELGTLDKVLDAFPGKGSKPTRLTAQTKDHDEITPHRPYPAFRLDPTW